MKQNQSKLALQSTLDAFKAKIKPGSTVLIYFGGYGIQAGRQNYFVPIGAQIWTEADVVRDGVSIESVLAALNASGARVKLAVLDLSRRNPFERRFRSYSAGLGSVGTPAYPALPPTSFSIRRGWAFRSLPTMRRCLGSHRL